MVDVTLPIAIFIAIVAAAGVFLFLGTVGLKGDKKDDKMHKQDEIPR